MGSADKNLYSVSKNGELIWRFSTNGQIVDIPQVDQDKIYFGSMDKNFYCINKKGTLKWKAHVGGACEGEAEQMGRPRAQALDRGRQETTASQRARDRARQ